MGIQDRPQFYEVVLAKSRKDERGSQAIEEQERYIPQQGVQTPKPQQRSLFTYSEGLIGI